MDAACWQPGYFRKVTLQSCGWQEGDPLLLPVAAGSEQAAQWTRAGLGPVPPGALLQAGGCSCSMGSAGSPGCCSSQKDQRLSRETQRREKGTEYRKKLGCRADSVTDVAG